jgi:hypothetical protein
MLDYRSGGQHLAGPAVMVLRTMCVERIRCRTSSVRAFCCAMVQGLTLAPFRAQLEDLRDTSLTLELNSSTCGTHSRINVGHMGDKLSVS